MSESTKTKVSKYTNLEPNVAAALAYIVTPLTGIMLFVIEKDDKFVRFHAFQSILLGIFFFVTWTMATALIVVFIGVFLAPLVTMGFFVVYLLSMWKAFNGEEYELPYIGKIAKEQANK